MSYVTAITDRVLSDVTPTPTAKGYMNVADWIRIYGNTKLSRSLALIELSTTILFVETITPTITTTSNIYSMIACITFNIERLRLAVAGETIVGTTQEIKDDYVAGANGTTPNYTDINLWESTVDAIWEHWDGPDLPDCPTLAADLVVTTGNRYIAVGCINMNGHDIQLEGTANLYII